MSVHGKFESIALAAGQDLSVAGAQYKAVSIAGTIAASSAAAFGLAMNKPKSGEHLEVGYFGHLKGYAGAAINSGSAVGVTTSGFLITVTGSNAVGKCLTQAASGDLFDFLGNFVGASV